MKTYGKDASWRGLQYAVSKLKIGWEKPFFLAKILIIFYHVIALSNLYFLRFKVCSFSAIINHQSSISIINI
jgi:hypothetical protein